MYEARAIIPSKKLFNKISGCVTHMTETGPVRCVTTKLAAGRGKAALGQETTEQMKC
jgi:hypothetical protein